MEPATPQIIVMDDREAGGLVEPHLRSLGATVLTQRLLVGDFVASDRVGIERKTSADFESSVIDGRLFAQAAGLSQAFEAPIIAVVGREFERLGKNAVRGALISLIVDYRLPVLFFDSEEKLAGFINDVAKREQLDSKRLARAQNRKKPAEPAKLRQLIVESLPGIGPATAKALLESFGSVENVFTADEDELVGVEGIGEKTAVEIRRTLSSK